MLVGLIVLLGRPAGAEPAHRFALGMFHFNVQYVAGGLEGILPTAEPIAAVELDAEAVEDAIVRESFEPVLDLFLAHPGWGVDIELQGLMLDVMAARHPDVLDKLRRLASAGRISVVSFHYSDQLFLGYPRAGWERSQRLTREAFERHGIPLSTTVFCQEGQAGPGMAAAMAERGYEVLVWPPNLYRFLHGDGPVAPLLAFGEGVTIVGRDGVHPTPAGEIEVVWTFLDDGEKLATGDWDPYFAPVFVHRPEAVAAYERELEELEARGFAIASVQRYRQALDALGVAPADPPPLIGGTWQPQSANGIRKWFGGIGLWSGAERDNEVRTLGALAHREVVTAETLAQIAGLGRSAEERLMVAWRLVALAQVSDASGINPFRGEVEYGIAHATEALRIARQVIREAKTTLGRGTDRLWIDTARGTLEPAPRARRDGHAVQAPMTISVDAPGRQVVETWSEIEPGLWRLRLEASPATGDGDRSLHVMFPATGPDLLYSPGLADDTVLRAPREAFVWSSYHLMLANGLVGLGADRWVVKDQGLVHVAATVPRVGDTLSFGDETAPRDLPVRWDFLVVDGDEARALQVADRTNVHPELIR